jgi:hypothetical protein
MNERTNERTKRRSIQSSLTSFFLFSRKRERTRAQKFIISHFFATRFIQRGKETPHPSISFTDPARAFKRETREEKSENKNNSTTTHRTLTLLFLETTTLFKRTDCATADWVTENILYVGI